MTPPDATLAWSDAQLEAEISDHIPEDAEFVCEWLNDVWSARVERQGEAVHAATHLDRRMALYEVYGVLWLSLQPVATRPTPWDPTLPRPTVASVSQYIRSQLADPEDLDPVEVAAVYGVRPAQPGRN